MDSFKTWIVEVAWKKMGPSLIKGAIAAGLGVMATHQGILNSLGITWDAAGHVIQIDLDMFSTWAIMGGSGVIMALFTAIQHHSVAVVTGQPQDGDVRATPTQPLAGGERAGDPPKVA